MINLEFKRMSLDEAVNKKMTPEEEKLYLEFYGVHLNSRNGVD